MAASLPPPATVVFMETAPTFEWMRGNLFRISDPNTGITWIAEASVLADGIAAAARGYSDYRERQSAQIIQFPDQADAAH